MAVYEAYFVEKAKENSESVCFEQLAATSDAY